MEVLAHQRGKLLSVISMLALPIPILTEIFGSHKWAVGLMLGILFGLVDQWIMLTGIKAVKPYYIRPRSGVIRFKIFTLLRLANATGAIILVLRLKDCTGGLVAGFLLIHILFIITLLTITYRRDSVKKGE